MHSPLKHLRSSHVHHGTNSSCPWIRVATASRIVGQRHTHRHGVVSIAFGTPKHRQRSPKQADDKDPPSQTTPVPDTYLQDGLGVRFHVPPTFDHAERVKLQEVAWLERYQSKMAYSAHTRVSLPTSSQPSAHVQQPSSRQATPSPAGSKPTQLSHPPQGDESSREVLRLIASASSLDALAAVLNTHLPAMNALCVSACAVQLTRVTGLAPLKPQRAAANRTLPSTGRPLASRQQQQWQPGMPQQADRRQSARATSTGAVPSGVPLSSAPAPAELLLQRLLKQLHSVGVGSCDAQGISNLLWVLAKFRHKDWTTALLLLQEAVVKAPSMNGQNVSNIFYSAAQLGFKAQGETTARIGPPSRGAATGSAALQEQQQQGRDLEMQQMSAVIPVHVLHALLRGTAGTLYMMQAQGFSNIVWALARMGHAPSPAWLSHYFSCSSKQLYTFRPQHLATVMWALARFGAQPDGEWLARFWELSLRGMPRFTMRDLANTAWALANLDLRPDDAWTQALLAEVAARCKQQQQDEGISSGRHRGSGSDAKGAYVLRAQRGTGRDVDAAAVAGLFYALARWGHRPGPNFLQAVYELLEGGSTAQVANTPPSDVASARFVSNAGAGAVLTGQSGKRSPGGGASAVSGSVVPSQQPAGRADLLATFTAMQLADVLRSAAALSLNLPPGMKERCTQHLAVVLPQLPVGGHVRRELRSALKKLQMNSDMVD